MSGLLAGKVWISNLDPNLKPLAATLADLGGDDGSSIYPSVAYICWRLGKSESVVREGLGKLREMGVLVVIGYGKGGRGKATMYQMVEENLPARPSWKEFIKGPDSGGFMDENPTDGSMVYDENPPAHRAKPSGPPLKTLRPTGPQPLVTVSQPSVETGWKIFRNTFYGFLGVYPEKNKSAVEKFQSAFRRVGGVEFETRMRAWLVARAEGYKEQGTQSYAANNFLDEVDDFEPSAEAAEEEDSFPEL